MFAKKYTQNLNKAKWASIATWVILFAIMGIMFGVKLMDATQEEFSPPDDAEATRANDLMSEKFADWGETSTFILVIERTDHAIVLGSDTAEFTFSLVSELSSEHGDTFTDFFAYYLLEGTALDSVKYQTLSDDGKVTFISIDGKAETEKEADQLVEPLRDAISEILDDMDNDEIIVSVTGTAAMSKDNTDGMIHDLKTIDAFVLPLAFLLLVFLLRSWKTAALSIGSVVMSLLIAFGILERTIEIADITVLSFVPSVMFSLTLGIGVDYSLFTLARFREERQNGRTVEESVETMLRHAGHNILVSGLTLMVSVLGLVLFPMSVISSLGYAVTAGVLVTLLANLTFVPAVLLACGGWFQGIPESVAEKTPDAEIKMETTINPEDKEKQKPAKDNYWHRVGEFATSKAWLVLGLTLLISIPLSIQVLDLEYGTSFTTIAPQDSESREGFIILEESFGAGMISPLTVVMEAPDGVLTQGFFDDQHNFIASLVQELDVDPFSISCVSWLNGSPIPYNVSAAAFGATNVSALPADMQLYLLYASQYLSDDNTCSYLEVVMSCDPFGSEGRQFAEDVRLLIEEEDFVAIETALVGGNTANLMDMMDASYDLLPWMILLVVFVVYILIALMFKSALLPARLIITVGLTISVMYAATNYVFAESEFMGDIFDSMKGSDSVYWLVPIMSFSILVGLGLDYDIFMVERVKEFAWSGQSDREAIKHALEKTGTLITGAGGVMVIALGGLMFSSSMILKQFGFLLAFAVLLDTFVVRTLLVPSIMALAEKWNWWPSVPPGRTKKEHPVGSTKTGDTENVPVHEAAPMGAQAD